MRNKFNTVGLFTTDNKSMVVFYRDVMGFTTDWNTESKRIIEKMRLLVPLYKQGYRFSAWRQAD